MNPFFEKKQRGIAFAMNITKEVYSNTPVRRDMNYALSNAFRCLHVLSTSHFVFVCGAVYTVSSEGFEQEANPSISSVFLFVHEVGNVN